jgi:hypothetical protein
MSSINKTSIRACPWGLRCKHGLDCKNPHSVEDKLFFRAVDMADKEKKKKTMLCRHFQNGNCKHDRAEDCDFAHGEADLCSVVVLGRDKQYTPQNQKTVLCRHFQNGNCKHDSAEDCDFAHGEDDLRSDVALDEDTEQQNVPANYKTMSCRHFRGGNCARGKKCNFAHGENDLRSAPRPCQDLSKDLAKLKV